MSARNIALLALCQAVLMTGSSLLVSTSALVGRELAGDPRLATIPLGLQFLAMTVATIPTSLLMERFGRRAGFLVGVSLGLFGATLATWAIAADRYVILCVAAVMLGAFNGTGQFYRFAAADVVGPAYRSRAISLVLAGGIAAGFFGPNLAAWTRQLLPVSFAGSYLSLVVLYVVSLSAIALLRIPRPAATARTEAGRPLGEIARQPAFVVAVLGATVGYGVMNLVMVATPLAMERYAHAFGDTAFVIQFHVLGMFVPSFFTGHLIRRFGEAAIMGTGVMLLALCVAVNESGNSVWHFWAALISLGLGWNFLFIGGTSLLTETYRESEKAKVQAANDFTVFATVTVTALSSGALLDSLGWRTLNLLVLPFLGAVLAALLWLRTTRPAVAPARVAD